MANNDVKTSLGDMHDVARVFNKYDLNGDGKISKEELKAALEALGSHATQEEVDMMIAEIDKNGDQLIDLAEFTEFHAGSAITIETLRDAFTVFDKNGDGFISASEVQAVLKSLGEKCTVKDCVQMVAKFDVDGDGFVNFEEFRHMMRI